ncbi:hypothetical protein PF011_g20997 [Phytophthora fragariae]|uniref:Secreted protein n=1 Tax=Phytophthora fragariae TaxID=53985 RepID=A0A6A3ILS9_9STRA|nr:hypothetical protein PF003_g13528 [Phytophthora fragariae]KAE8917419.1 hypothetical protein PF009_g32259 [Phytophthora fragariae]KAE8983886.1 hypothetical protein PF011_g20997 [Phytophthora fragariae]KAE9265081.1 hypothetical protein PF008_g31955 [Phytophthora fragariae]
MLRWSAVMIFLVARASLVTSCARASCQVYSRSGTLPTGIPKYRDNLVTGCTCSGAGRAAMSGIASAFNAITRVFPSLSRNPDASANSPVMFKINPTSRSDRT